MPKNEKTDSETGAGPGPTPGAHGHQAPNPNEAGPGNDEFGTSTDPGSKLETAPGLSPGYLLGANEQGDKWIECLTCHRRSLHSGDIENLYCASCGKRHLPMGDVPNLSAGAGIDSGAADSLPDQPRPDNSAGSYDPTAKWQCPGCEAMNAHPEIVCRICGGRATFQEFRDQDAAKNRLLAKEMISFEPPMCLACGHRRCHGCGCCHCDRSDKGHGCKSGGCPCFGPSHAIANSAGAGPDSGAGDSLPDQPRPAMQSPGEYRCNVCSFAFVYQGPDPYPSCPKCNEDDPAANSLGVGVPVRPDNSAGVGPIPNVPNKPNHPGYPSDNSAGVGSDSKLGRSSQDEGPQPPAVTHNTGGIVYPPDVVSLPRDAVLLILEHLDNDPGPKELKVVTTLLRSLIGQAAAKQAAEPAGKPLDAIKHLIDVAQDTLEWLDTVGEIGDMEHEIRETLREAIASAREPAAEPAGISYPPDVLSTAVDALAALDRCGFLSIQDAAIRERLRMAIDAAEPAGRECQDVNDKTTPDPSAAEPTIEDQLAAIAAEVPAEEWDALGKPPAGSAGQPPDAIKTLRSALETARDTLKACNVDPAWIDAALHDAAKGLGPVEIEGVCKVRDGKVPPDCRSAMAAAEPAGIVYPPDLLNAARAAVRMYQQQPPKAVIATPMDDAMMTLDSAVHAAAEPAGSQSADYLSGHDQGFRDGLRVAAAEPAGDDDPNAVHRRDPSAAAGKAEREAAAEPAGEHDDE